MIITINGQKHELPQTKSIRELLDEQGYNGMLVAVALNSSFIPRDTYNSVILAENDDIEIVAPMQGG